MRKGSLVAVAVVVAAAALAGCSALEAKTCTMAGQPANGVAVYIHGGAISSQSRWTQTVCTKAGCSTAAVREQAPGWPVENSGVSNTHPVVVTARLADSTGLVAPAVTTTVTPTPQMVNGPGCEPTNYHAQVTVTPTR